MMVWGMYRKKGISIETAEQYAEAVMESMGRVMNDPISIQLLIAAKYTTDPRNIYTHLGLLHKLFTISGQSEHRCTWGWAYLEFVHLNIDNINQLERSNNKFSRLLVVKLAS